MFNIAEMKEDDLIEAGKKDAHPTYKRMMDAAEKLHGLTKASDVGAFLDLDSPSQQMNAWRVRGIAANKITYVARRLGCHPYWLEDGEGDMLYDKMLDPDLLIAMKVMQPLSPYGRQMAIKSLNQTAELIEEIKASPNSK